MSQKKALSHLRVFFYCLLTYLVLVLVEKEIVLRRIIGPEVFDAFVDLTLVFDFLKVLDDLFLSTRTQSPIQQLVTDFEANSSVQYIVFPVFVLLYFEGAKVQVFSQLARGFDSKI